MSEFRAPRLAGIAGGVGTTTLATALRGYDRGCEAERGVDVLVCRTTGQSLQLAATFVSWLVAGGRPRPVLAVTSDQPGAVRGACKARLRMIEPQVAGLVVLPYVHHWRDLADPLAEAARLSGETADELPRPLRGYAQALAALAGEIIGSGLLTHPTFATGPISGPISRPIPIADSGSGPLPRIEPAARPRSDAGADNVLELPLSQVAAYGGAR